MVEKQPIYGSNFPLNSVKTVRSIIPVNSCQMVYSQAFLPQPPTRIRSLTQHPVCKCVYRYVHVMTSLTYVSDCTLLTRKGPTIPSCSLCKYQTHTEPVNTPNQSMEIKASSHPLSWRQSLTSQEAKSALSGTPASSSEVLPFINYLL